MTFDYDLFVIGAGSGGVRASRIASSLDAKVAIAESTYFGGTCVNVGCIPKKLFSYAAEFSKSFKTAESFGWQVTAPQFQWQILRDHKTREIQRLNGVYESLLHKAGVTIFSGHAKIEGAQEVSVNGQSYHADKILIAVGGQPKKLEFPGAEWMLNSNDAFYLPELPKKIIVQGGGYIAVEFASIFNGLGCDVELLHRSPKFLRGFDEEVRDVIARELRASGIKLSFNTEIEKITRQEKNCYSVYCDTGEIKNCEAVFSAVGRAPSTESLGLENTRVKLGDKGEILVNDHFQTEEPSIYALGDVIGRVELTPVALTEAMALAKHLFGGQALGINYHNIPTAVFCQPNIAAVGTTEQQLQASNTEYRVYRSQFKALKNTLTESDERVFMKVLVDAQTDKVLGAHMVGPDAGELIQGVAIAMQAGATKAHFDATIGIHPTSAEEFVTLREAGKAYIPAIPS